MAKRIRQIYRQGGEDYRDALVLWQMVNAVYHGYVAEEDYPKLMPRLWRLPVPND